MCADELMCGLFLSLSRRLAVLRALHTLPPTVRPNRHPWGSGPGSCSRRALSEVENDCVPVLSPRGLASRCRAVSQSVLVNQSTHDSGIGPAVSPSGLNVDEDLTHPPYKHRPPTLSEPSSSSDEVISRRLRSNCDMIMRNVRVMAGSDGGLDRAACHRCQTWALVLSQWRSSPFISFHRRFPPSLADGDICPPIMTLAQAMTGGRSSILLDEKARYSESSLHMSTRYGRKKEQSQPQVDVATFRNLR